MEKEKFHKNAYDMIYLTRCAMDGKKPDPEHLQDLNLEELFEVCEKHTMTACVAYALESAGIRDNRFSQAKEKSIRKNVLLDADRKKVLSRLEQEKIWYMPLKGAIMKDWYPKLGMRQMSDNDILYDGAYREKVRDIMLEIGFTCEHFGTGHDDSYYKQPVSNFEMHHALFSVSHAGKAYDYYKDVKERLLKDETNEYGYHFSIEDFYIYMTAHEYRHYENRGTGGTQFVRYLCFCQKVW